MGKKSARPNSVDIPNDPEFWFLRDYLPLNSVQRSDLLAVSKLFRRWENLAKSSSSRHRAVEKEGSAFIEFISAMDSFKSQHGFTDPPSDPIGAVRAKVRSYARPTIALLQLAPAPNDYQSVIDDVLETWWERLDGVTNPPPKRPIVSTHQEALAGLAMILRAVDQLASRQQRSQALPVGKPVELVAEEAQPALSDRQYETLDALLDLKAFDPAHKATTPEIAKRAVGASAYPKWFKKAIAGLKRLGLVGTKEGRGGGCWLTPAGRAFIQRIRKI
jgi:hypothetical protein